MAVEYLAMAVAARPNSVDALYNYGVALLKSGGEALQGPTSLNSLILENGPQPGTQTKLKAYTGDEEMTKRCKFKQNNKNWRFVPFFDSNDIHIFAGGIIFDLVFVDLSDGKVRTLRTGEAHSADRRCWEHGQ